MTIALEERKKRKKIRLTISNILVQSCEDCPIAKSKSVNDRVIYCATECAVGQKMQGLSLQLQTKEKPGIEWSEDEDFYIIHHFPQYGKRMLAKKMNRPADDIRDRFKYLISRGETKRGKKS